MKTPALVLQGLPAVSRMSINLQENDLILWLNRSLDSNLIERIIYIDDDNNTAFLFNIHARQGFPYPILIAEIVEAISKGEATKRPKDPWSSLNHEENLTDSQIYHRDRRWDIIKSLVGQEPDIYYEHLRVSLIQEFVNHYNQQKKTGKLEATTVYEYLTRLL